MPYFHWPAIAKLATALRRTVTVPIYPIAPEHTYREVFPFLLQVYRRELETRDPSSIAFMGDSAGGGMAFALCHAVRDAGLPAPTDAVLLSPWMHLALPDPDVPGVAKIDPFLNPEDLRAAGIRYAGGDSLDTPLLSPSVGPLTGLPRLTVFTGTHDVLNPDARAFRKRAAAEGLDIGWYELDGGVHAWMLLPGRDAARALDQIARGVEQVTSVVVIGSGFAGLWAALGAARRLDELGVPGGHRRHHRVERQAFSRHPGPQLRGRFERLPHPARRPARPRRGCARRRRGDRDRHRCAHRHDITRCHVRLRPTGAGVGQSGGQTRGSGLARVRF